MNIVLLNTDDSLLVLDVTMYHEVMFISFG